MTKWLRVALLLVSVSTILLVRSDEKVCSVDGTCEEVQEPCLDEDEKCTFWASVGECKANPLFMLISCRTSCGMCERTVDLSMGEPQIIAPEYPEECRDRLMHSREYMNEVANDPETSFLVDLCLNQNESCTFWAIQGECDNNPNYMRKSCAPACHTCDQVSIITRCPLDPDAPNVWGPGDLNKFFQRITTSDEFAMYTPKVLSRPEFRDGDTEETADYMIGPWVVILENFVTPTETDRLIELGAVEGYERSANYGDELPDGSFDSSIDESRTSRNAWCQDACYEDPDARNVINRIAHLTQSPEENSEYVQLLKYEEGQYYTSHHDYVDHEVQRQQGVRLLTVFLYLNDVEEGGGTNFTELNLTVLPQRGRALVWPSVLDEDPDDVDWRTMHEALPVIKGVKYGANAWIHQRNFKGPHEVDCT